jgi:cation diffusion facilitator CzcD-associated flavoprotein CzcO
MRFAIIGAGMSGILSAIKLQEAGFGEVTLYEKADRLGGTWRENTYPGIACDVPSHLYSYSFAPNPEWSHRFSPGGEIQAYFEGVARKHGVERRIRFGDEVTRCEFSGGRWHLETKSGCATRSTQIAATACSTTNVPRSRALAAGAPSTARP